MKRDGRSNPRPTARRFDRVEAVRLRERGMSYAAIGRELGVHAGAIHKALGPTQRGLRACEWCGGQATYPKTRFCSEACRQYETYARTKSPGKPWATVVQYVRECAWCKRRFKTRLGRVAHSVLYCSDRCQNQSKVTALKAERHRSRRKLRGARECAHCSEAFSARTHHHIYCTVRCAKDAKLVRTNGGPMTPLRICAFEGCNNDFRGRGRQAFCFDKDCKAARAKSAKGRMAKDSAVARARGFAANDPIYARASEINKIAREQAEDAKWGDRVSDLRTLSLNVAVGEDGDMTWMDTLTAPDAADAWLAERDGENA